MRQYPNEILIRLSCLIYFFAFNACTIYGAPTVTITNGTLVGTIMHTRLQNEIHAYQGIPYAAPPVEELRFKVKNYIVYCKIYINKTFNIYYLSIRRIPFVDSHS